MITGRSLVPLRLTASGKFAATARDPPPDVPLRLGVRSRPQWPRRRRLLTGRGQSRHAPAGHSESAATRYTVTVSVGYEIRARAFPEPNPSQIKLTRLPWAQARRSCGSDNR